LDRGLCVGAKYGAAHDDPDRPPRVAVMARVLAALGTLIVIACYRRT